MFAKSFRAALVVGVVTGSLGLFDMPRAHAIDMGQFMCDVVAQKAYNDRGAQVTAEEGKDPIGAAIDGALSKQSYEKQLGVCRMRGSNVGSFPYRSRF
jgi:hypothetical protein